MEPAKDIEKPGEIPKAPTSPAPTGPVTPITSDGWEGGQTPELTEIVPKHQRGPGWLSFQVNALLLLQRGGGNSFTGQVAWTPQFAVDRYTLRGELGFGLPKNSLGDLFLSVNYELFFRTRINPNTFLDIGGGGQTWSGARGVTRPIASAQISRRYNTHTAFDLLFFGYSAYFASPMIHSFKLGVGFNL